MLESNKKIWEKLEKNIGHCILFRDAALKEILGEDSFTLQFATLTVPEKVEAFLEGNEDIKIIRNETYNYLFVMDGTRVEVHCFDSKPSFDCSYKDMFDRAFRCENLGINFIGQFNNNVDAYNDIIAKELHFSSNEPKITEFMLPKIVRYVLNSGFVIGEDILEYVKINKIFENKVMRGRFLGALSENIRKESCSWERIATALGLIESILPSSDFIKYTKGLGSQDKNDKFIRNYLYSLFIFLDITGQELQRIIPKEPTLEFFDSIALNIDVCLGEYKIYVDIKNKYGDEFLELLMDVQESVANSLGLDYKRVSEDTFDMGQLFFNESRFWCSLDEMKNEDTIEAKNTSQKTTDETFDASQGNAAGWMTEKYNKEMYSDVTDSTEDKIYIDDEVEEEIVDSGIDMTALDTYEDDATSDENKEEASNENIEIQRTNESIMNSQRGHESTVLNSGGV